MKAESGVRESGKRCGRADKEAQLNSFRFT